MVDVNPDADHGLQGGGTRPIIQQRAYAKLNLSLAVGARGPDGYHQIDSLMAPLELYDLLSFQATGREVIELEVTGPMAAETPSDKANLAWRAAERLAAWAARPADVRIVLDKNIPVGGGLAGGSADAAATLLALNTLWKLDLKPEDLTAIAASLGSDVPFCLCRRPAWVGGRGEKVRPLAEPLPPLWALLVFPGLHVSTAAVYRRLDEMRDKKMASKRCEMHLAGLTLYNELQEAALDVCPALDELYVSLQRLGLPRVMVAGSGSTLCSVFQDLKQAQRWADQLKSHLRHPVKVAAVGRAGQII